MQHEITDLNICQVSFDALTVYLKEETFVSTVSFNPSEFIHLQPSLSIEYQLDQLHHLIVQTLENKTFNQY